MNSLQYPSRSPSASPSPSGSAPPDHFKAYYKLHRHLSRSDIHLHHDILTPDVDAYSGDYTIIRESVPISNTSLTAINEFLSSNYSTFNVDTVRIKQLPGLQIISNLLPSELQRQLVCDTIEEYLPPREHLTNLDVHYNLPRPLNIFDDNDSIPHKCEKPPLQMSDLRSKKLRWVCLGGQYEWTSKVYPSFVPGSEGFPYFPPRLDKLLNSMFNINPEAAIINFYSPGDILSPHQDVAELTKADLISISLGCDCIFYIGENRDSKPLAVLLKSGDTIVMGGDSRFAYHGVGKVFSDTCPGYLIENEKYDDVYKSWIMNKRININVRQVLN